MANARSFTAEDLITLEAAVDTRIEVLRGKVEACKGFGDARPFWEQRLGEASRVLTKVHRALGLEVG